MTATKEERRASPGDRLEFNRKEIARLLGVSDATVGRWVDEGAPCITRAGKGNAVKIDGPAFLAWWAANKVKADAPTGSLRDRDLLLDIERKELELATRRAELVGRPAAVKVIRDLLVGLAMHLRSVPRRHAHQLLGVSGMAEAVRRLTVVTEDVIAELRVPDPWQSLADAPLCRRCSGAIAVPGAAALRTRDGKVGVATGEVLTFDDAAPGELEALPVEDEDDGAGAELDEE